MAGPALKRLTSHTSHTNGHSSGHNGKSIGGLVSLAAADVSQLVRSEIELAKLELKKDARKMAIGAALLAIAAFTGCLILLFGGIAAAIALAHAIAWPIYAGFALIALICLLLAALGALIGLRRFRKLDRMRKTRRTVQDDITMLKHDGTPSVSRAP